MRALIIAAIAVLVPDVACASSDDAWKALARNAKTTCTAEIKKQDGDLTALTVEGVSIGIGGKDGDQYYAMTFKSRGKYGSGLWLCLYDKHTRKPSVSTLVP